MQLSNQYTSNHFSRLQSLSPVFNSITIVLCILFVTVTLPSHRVHAAPLEEIVVTAQKREQSLQEVPLSITAISGENLNNNGIENIEQLQYATPGLSFSQTNGSSFIYIRGVGSDIIGLGDSSVSYNVDGVYVGRPEAALTAFSDVERIEVLRGPQGTLYGRNATGGSINVITKKPTDEFAGNASLQLGNFNKIEFQGAVSGGLSDRLLGRVAVRYSERDGYIDNLLAGSPLHSDIVAGPLPLGLSDPLLVQKGSSAPDELGDEEVFSVIGKLLWDVSDRTTVAFNADFTLDEDNGPNLKVLAPQGLVFDLGATQTLDIHQTEINEGVFEDQRSAGLSATIDVDFGDVALKSITAYRDFTNESLLDSDGDDLRGVDFLQDLDQDQTTQEFQLSGGTDRFQWLTGLFYLREDANWNALVFAGFGVPFNQPPIPPGTNPPANIIFEFRSLTETDAWAVFGQTTYSLSDTWSLTAGARYSYEKKENTTSTPDIFVGTPFSFGLTTPVSRSESWNAFTPKLGLEYRATDDTMWYLSISRGFKSGGYNSTATAASQLAPFDPEFILAYEAGVKSTLMDGRMQLNGSVFYYDYEDLQVFSFNGFASATIENAASAENFGGEIEIITQPTDRFKVYLAAAYLDATYENYLSDGAQIGQPGAPISLSGNTIRNSPEWSFNAALGYDLPLNGGGSVNFSVNGNYKSDVFFDQFNQAILSQDDLFLVNARVAYTLPNDRWQVSAFVRNLTDEEYIVGAVGLPAQNNAPQGYAGNPRTYGMQINYGF